MPPVKECGHNSEGKPIHSNGVKGCERMILASYMICPFCGFKYPEKDLKEIDLQAMMFSTQEKKAIKTKRIRDMTMTELHTYWKQKGHKSAWLWRQLWYKGGEKQIVHVAVRFFFFDAVVGDYRDDSFLETVGEPVGAALGSPHSDACNLDPHADDKDRRGQDYQTKIKCVRHLPSLSFSG